MSQRTSRKREFVAVPTTFYLGGLDSYVRARLKSPEYFAPASTTAFTLDHKGGEAALERATLDVAAALILGDGVALTVTGDNAVLAYLTRMFGVHGASELIRTGVIEFVAESHAPGKSVSPLPIVRNPDGTLPPPGDPIFVTFVWAQQEPKVFPNNRFDAEAAATIALRRFASELGIDRRDIGELSRRAAKHTHVVPYDRVAGIISRVGAAYRAGELESLDLSPKIARDKNVYHDNDLADLAMGVYYTENLLDFELDQYQMPEQWFDVRRFTSEVTSGPHVLRSIDKVMELRRAADIRALFRDRVLKIEDIARLRDHPAARSFRRWLWAQPDPADAEAVVEEFLRAITDADRKTVASYMQRLATVVAVTVVQNRALDALQVPPEARIGADAALSVAQLLGGAVVEKFKTRPPSAFFDQVIDPAINAASNGRAPR